MEVAIAGVVAAIEPWAGTESYSYRNRISAVGVTAVERPIDQKRYYGTNDRPDKARGMNSLIFDVVPEQHVGDEPTHERSDDPKQDCGAHRHWISSRYQCAGYKSSNKSNNDHANNKTNHGFTSHLMAVALATDDVLSTRTIEASNASAIARGT